VRLPMLWPWLGRPLRIMRYLGAGLIAGASDNDPTTVGTLAIIGASTGYRLTWLVLLLLPMLVTVQIVSTRLGAVTRQHFLEVIAACYGRRWAWVAALLVVSVCVITIGADLEGGAAALSLLTGRPWPWFVVPLALFVGGLLLFGSYTAVERALRYVLLIFIAYPVAAFLAQPPWGAVLAASFQPAVEFSGDYLSAALALLGTTLTSYVYIWQTVEIKEERPPLAALPLLELDAAVGIVVTVAMFWFIVVATGATLGASGQRVQTAQDAAAALAPLAGPLAGAVFAIGLLGSALIALPVLAATTGYCVAALYGWPAGLSARSKAQTWRFYAVVLGSLVLGAALTLLGIDPMQLLFVASIVGGLGTPVLLALLLLLARSERVMGAYAVRGWLAAAGWGTVAIVSLASVAYLVQQFLGDGGSV